MELTLAEIVGFFGIIGSIATATWIIGNRFGEIDARFEKLEARVGGLEEKLDEILLYIRGKKLKHLRKKH